MTVCSGDTEQTRVFMEKRKKSQLASGDATTTCAMARHILSDPCMLGPTRAVGAINQDIDKRIVGNSETPPLLS